MSDLVHAIDPRTGSRIEPAIAASTPADVERLCAAAAAAAPVFRAAGREARARLLEAIADEIGELGDALIERVMAESGLPRPRLEGERGRTVGQLRTFARVVRDGDFLDARIDGALPERKPLPRPDLRLRQIGVGPVAVFGASNFPLAFSVAGGDTASALAAGCPVIVKAHPAHPGTSEMIAAAIRAALARSELPAGVFGIVFESGTELGAALVADPRIKAVGFTGSRRGGLALLAAAAARPEPIPVFAEMSSINPVILFPAALAARGEAIGRAFAASLQLGAGQFCTNPGLVLAVDGPGLDGFAAAAAAAIGGAAGQTMLTPGIHAAYERATDALAGHAGVRTLARGAAGSGTHEARPALFETTGETFAGDEHLQAEVFGSSSLLVRVPDAAGLRAVLERLEGQLTVALHIDEADHADAAALLPLLEDKAGRILVNGFGTGVEVADSMVHGGPFPATADARTTSVGTLAIRRFLRPVCYQDLPAALLAPELRDGNPDGINRMIDGRLARH